MTKSISLLFLLFFLQITFGNCQATNKIFFKIRFQPSRVYTQKMKQSNHSETIYIGNKEAMDRLKERGIKNPEITEESTETESVSTTGKAVGERFPITVQFIKTTTTEEKKDIPDSTTIYAHGSDEKYATVDSVHLPGMTKDENDEVKQAMQSLFHQINFPAEQVSVGEEMTRTYPVNMTISGVNVIMTIETHYKLTAIRNDSALFDVTQVYGLKSDNTGKVLKATGTSNGKLVYDIKNNYYLSYDISTKLYNTVKIKDLKVDITTTSKFSQSIKIEPAP